MKRYDLETHYSCGESYQRLDPTEDGDWVRWEDVEAVISAAYRLIRESCDCHEQDRQEGRVICRCGPRDTVPACGWCRDVAAWLEIDAVKAVREARKGPVTTGEADGREA